MGSIFRVNTNVSAIFARRQTAIANRSLQTANERLASGLRINSAADDAAGLAVSEKLRTQIRGLRVAERNAQDGISVLQTAEGGMESVNEKLQRIRELAVQAANDSLTDTDRGLLQEEVDELVNEIDRTSSAVTFNTKNLLNQNQTLTFHVGAEENEVIDITLSATTTSTLGVDSVNVETRSSAEGVISTVDTAINSLNAQRARVGASQNRLESTIDFLRIQQENFQASESRIRDADIAEEAVARTRSTILIQAGTAVLAQSQQNPQLALQLL